MRPDIASELAPTREEFWLRLSPFALAAGTRRVIWQSGRFDATLSLIPMKTISLLLLGIACLLAGCSSPGSRVAANRAEFNTWPPEVQDNVLAGRIDVGYSPAQVRMALGAPDRITTRKDSDGTSEVWTYGDRSPRFSWGLGIGSGSRNSSVGVGVSTTSRGRDTASRVVFDPTGKVSSIETAAAGR
jgi:hypothetical protein